MLKEIFREQKAFVMAGLVSFVFFVIFTFASLFDSTEILGVNRWMKPSKFFISIAIYIWTVAVFLHFLKGFERSRKIISWSMIAIFGIEMFIIVMQAFRGTTSHFNLKSPFDGMLFAIMGFGVLYNTILVGYILIQYFRAEIDLPESIIWGMRLGLLLFLFASFEGGYMSAQIGHSVGAPDGGAGLPIVNWSTKAGDLRVAHFFGMHALQAIPVFAYLVEKLRPGSAVFMTYAFSAVYFVVFSFLLIQALAGKPFIGAFY